MGRFGFFIGLALFLMVSPDASGQSVRAVVDRNRVSLGEAVMLTVTVENGDGVVDPSPIKDFQVISRGRTQSTQIINGRVSSSIGSRFALVPKKEGTFTIPKIPVMVDGKTLLTDEITIVVAQSKDNALVSESDLFVTAEVTDDSIYLGQEIVYTFRLHRAIEATDFRLYPPEFEGFTKTRIDQKRGYRKTINGRVYSIEEVLFLLTPTEAGEKKIEETRLSFGVMVQSRRSSDPFDSFFGDSFFGRGRIKSQMTASNPLTVNVSPLPENSEPLAFSGLIGTFDLTAALERDTLPVGDSVTFSITLEGSGNIRDAKTLDVDLPEEFKVYTDTPEEDITLSEKGHWGKKIYRKALVPLKEGTYKIPALKINYFDTEKERYVVKETDSFLLTVSPSADEKKALDAMITDDAAPLTLKKKKVAITGQDILPIKEGLDALKSEKDLSLIVFLLMLLSPPLIFVLTYSATRVLRKSVSVAARMLDRAQASLKKAEDTALSNEVFLSHLYKALTSAIFSRAGKKGESLTLKEAGTLLELAGCEEKIVREARSLLESVESASYSGESFSEKDRSVLLNQTQSLVRSIV